MKGTLPRPDRGDEIRDEIKKRNNNAKKLESTIRQIQALASTNPDIFKGENLDQNNPLVQIYSKIISRIVNHVK